jgi:hypothetical protein
MLSTGSKPSRRTTVHRALLVCNSTFPLDPNNLPDLDGPSVDGLYLWRELTHRARGLFAEESVSVLFERSRQEIMAKAEEMFGVATPNDDLVSISPATG